MTEVLTGAGFSPESLGLKAENSEHAAVIERLAEITKLFQDLRLPFFALTEEKARILANLAELIYRYTPELIDKIAPIDWQAGGKKPLPLFMLPATFLTQQQQLSKDRTLPMMYVTPQTL